MAKSIRSKREKRLRAIRRDMVQPLYDQKDAAKQSAIEAALAAPKLPVKPTTSSAAMETENNAAPIDEMETDKNSKFLKPLGRKMKKKLKLAKGKFHAKGKIKRKHV